MISFVPGSLDVSRRRSEAMERPRAHILLIAVIAAPSRCWRVAGAAAFRAAPDEPQVFKSGRRARRLHVNVFDGRSDAVPDLPQSAFTVFEDDKPQDIAFFSAGDVPVTVGLVIDNSTSMIDRARARARGNQRVRRVEPSRGRDVRGRLQRTRPHGTARARLSSRPTVCSSLASLGRFPPGGKTALYDAVIAGLDQLEQGAYQKHVLVVLSDGGDNASTHTEKEMLQRVRSSSALIYTIVDPDVFTPGEGNRGVLRRLAKLSGGSPTSRRANAKWCRTSPKSRTTFAAGTASGMRPVRRA